MASCVLCGTQGILDRQSGLDVCEPCRLGDFDAGLQRWGLTLAAERSQEQTGTSESRRTVDVLMVRVSYPSPFDALAHCVQESGLDRFWQLFRRDEPQAGDPLFDRAVFVDEGSGADLPALLADEGAQSAIMELVATGGVRLGPGWVRARRASSDAPPSLPELAIDLILLAVHVETLAQLS